MAAGRLDHAGVVVSDLDAATGFFLTWLDAQVVFRMDRFDDPTGVAPTRLGAPRGAGFALVMLELGGGRLELVQWWVPTTTEAPGGAGDKHDVAGSKPPGASTAVIELAPRPPGTHRIGMAHVAIEVDDVAAELERLGRAPDVEVLSDPVTFDAGPTPGLTNAFLRTSWGVLLELVSWPK